MTCVQLYPCGGQSYSGSDRLLNDLRRSLRCTAGRCPADAGDAVTTDPRRLARAVHLDAERLADGSWRVTGGTAPHIVSADGSECACADFAMRRAVCKHRARVLLALGDATTLAQLGAVVPMPTRQRRSAAT